MIIYADKEKSFPEKHSKIIFRGRLKYNFNLEARNRQKEKIHFS